MRTQCGPHILSNLRTKVRCLIFGIRILLHMHVFVCASMCEFRGQNYVKGGRMYNLGKLEIFKNDKMIIIIIIN